MLRGVIKERHGIMKEGGGALNTGRKRNCVKLDLNLKID